MPVSMSVVTNAAVKPAPAHKKNTVDHIPSKLSYDTAIPVSILDDRSEFIERCKPYDIIDGPNPLDDVIEESEPFNDNNAMANSAAIEAVKTGKSNTTTYSSRKRARSPLKNTAKTQHTKKESDRDGSAAAPALPVFTRPVRNGWAAEQLREGRPYQLLRSRDMETRARYVLDDYDYDWCAAQNLPSEVVQRGITYLEWAYTSALLTAATPRLDDSTVEAMSSLNASGNTVSASTDAENSIVTAFHSSSTTAQGDADSAAIFSPTANAIDRFNRMKWQSEREKQTAAFTCALCSKPVQLLSQQTSVESGAKRSGGSSAGERSGDQSRRGRGRSGAASVSSKNASHAPSKSKSASHAGVFPSYDLQHQGLRCCECGAIAHLRCWFLTKPPRLLEEWTCDGCTNLAQYRKRSAGVCCICGRMGGVLLPYFSSAAAAKEQGESKNRNRNDAQTSQLSRAQVRLNLKPAAQSEIVCHAVCALTVPELAIQHKDTVLQHNGLVNMEERPYVYALRRVGQQRFAMHCVFCQHGGSGRCVQCHHPHCFEAMHASCAAEAHTVDCHTELASSPSAQHPVGVPSPGGFFPNGSDESGGTSNNVTPSWASCSTYCKKHYGCSASSLVGSAALADKAEAEALALDLTGLVTGGDGATSPVVKRRGRGRPPVALVQRREAERTLIQKLHAHWLERREQRRRSSAQLVSEINVRLRPVVEAALRPEIVKVSADKVRLSRFLSLVPEWQWQLVAIVEGELPLPDEEYDDVQKYRKVAHTRRSGNTRSLYDRMCVAATQLNLVCRITASMKDVCRLQRANAALELESLRTLCMWE